MDKKTLNIALDLGSDSLKIAYAYEASKGKIEYGKITVSDSLVRVAFPALACYDDERERWIYGDQVDKLINASFVKVVKIKELVSLLLSKSNAKYYNEHHFPKFFFPRIEETFENYEKAIQEEKTFVEKHTPQTVCEGFFEYTKAMIDHRVRKLEEQSGINFDNIRISVIHPPKVGKLYIAELVRLVKHAFGIEPAKVLSSTKALGMYAKHTEKIGRDDNLVIFDMGEEDISISKVFIGKGDSLFVDGVEGHNPPLHIGGVNIDYAIAEYIENNIHERDTVGTPSANSKTLGHIYEDALIAKQYLFMKGVKKAKTILSGPADEDSLFKNGAPIGIYYEVYIQRDLTHSELAECIGTSTDSGLARQISDYILSELRMPLNRGLTSNADLVAKNPLYDHGYVMLSGGLSETYSLKKYIEDKIHNEFPDINVLSFDKNASDETEFSIQPHEGSAYAPAIGGALVALYDDEIKTILSLSYGTWVNCDNVRCLDIFIDRGRVLNAKNAFKIKYGFSSKVEGERLYSTIVTLADIQKGEFKGRKLDVRTDKNGKKYLHIGKEENDRYRASVKDLFKLETVAGGETATITAYYKGNEISHIYEQHSSAQTFITVTQGIDVDDNGKISPAYGIHESEKGRYVRIRCVNNRCTPSHPIPVTEIEIRGPKISVASEQG